MRAALSAAAAALLAACASVSAPGPEPLPPNDPRRLYPLNAGRSWTFAVALPDGERASVITRVVEVDGERATLLTGTERYELVVSAEGVRRGAGGDDGAWLLKSTIAPGQAWPGRGRATVRVAEMDATITVPAGTFEGCVRIHEDTARPGNGEVVARVETVYCPDVGPVKVVAEQGGEVLRAGELVAWGK